MTADTIHQNNQDKQHNPNRFWRGLLKFLITFALSVIAFIVSFGFVMSYNMRQMKRPVIGQVSDSFPLVAFFDKSSTGQFKAQALTYGELEDFKKAHPDYSFDLQPIYLEEMRKQLTLQATEIDDQIAKQYQTGRRMRVSASIEREFNGYQEWRVRLHHGNDRVNIGYYKTRANSLVPTFHELYFGPGLVFKSCPFSIIIFVVLFFFVLFMMNRFKYFKPERQISNAP